jgi:hypothetical protein
MIRAAPNVHYKGEESQTTFTVAIVLSPKVYERSRSNPLNNVFDFPNDWIDSNHVREWFEFVRSRSGD